MDDTLPVIVETRQSDAELTTISLQSHEHVFGEHIEKRPRPLECRDDVIDRTEGAIRSRHAPAPRTQGIEGLRRGDFVDQVQPDEKLRLTGG